MKHRYERKQQDAIDGMATITGIGRCVQRQRLAPAITMSQMDRNNEFCGYQQTTGLAAVPASGAVNDRQTGRKQTKRKATPPMGRRSKRNGPYVGTTGDG